MYKSQFSINDSVGRDNFESILDKYNLKIRKRIRKPRTTDSTHGLPVYPNLTIDFIPVTANMLWVSDITYIPIWIDEENYIFCYLSLILDSYSKEIIGWCVGPSLETEYPLKALKMALERIKNIPKKVLCLIHHSDRGVQYASSSYVNLLKSYNIQISMTECGDPKENAQAERINNTMKNELLKDMRFTSLEEVETAVNVAVKFYNEERPHMSIDMMTPKEAAKKAGRMKKKWISYREKYINEKNSIA